MRMVHAAAILAAASAAPAFAQEQAPNFSGGHLEAIVGLDNVSAGGESQTGALFGIAGGYDFRRGGAVFGIEAEAAEATTEECDGGICFEAGRDLYVGGRVGGVVSENVLLYAKLGYTNARVILDDGVTSVGANADGIRGGVGAEILAGGRFSVRTEYRYSNYEGGFSRHQGVLGLGIRF